MLRCCLNNDNLLGLLKFVTRRLSSTTRVTGHELGHPHGSGALELAATVPTVHLVGF